MIRKRIAIHEVEITDRFCDICENEAKGRRCSICERDLCEEHKHRERDPFGDYSTMYCIYCWKIGESYRRRIEVLAEIFEKEKEDLYNEWKKHAIEKARRE